MYLTDIEGCCVWFLHVFEPRFVAKHCVLVQLWLSELAHQVGAEKDLAAHVAYMDLNQFSKGLYPDFISYN